MTKTASAPNHAPLIAIRQHCCAELHRKTFDLALVTVSLAMVAARIDFLAVQFPGFSSPFPGITFSLPRGKTFSSLSTSLRKKSKRSERKTRKSIAEGE
jgi:hypothetical protein